MQFKSSEAQTSMSGVLAIRTIGLVQSKVKGYNMNRLKAGSSAQAVEADSCQRIRCDKPDGRTNLQNEPIYLPLPAIENLHSKSD